ncbi:MAG TPA: hypothetical protein VGC42_13945 [Kofleriaceae bacterium]
MDRAQLAAIPDVVVARSPAIERGIADSVAYLASDAAADSPATDLYWPKWHSPWWHALLLFELGEGRQIPARATDALVAATAAFPLKYFPIHPGEAPPGTDLSRDVLCHCAIGSLAQMLGAAGVDVETEPALGFVAPWLARYQMADGGLSCDDQAYLAAERTGECPSSMVGTIAPFEAMLARGADDGDFVARAARFLIGRALVRGSDTAHNADERAAATRWPEPCFPRFYFYDVLRGLSALVRWAERTGASLPGAALAEAVDALVAQSSDGVVRVGRRAHADHTTVVPSRDRREHRPRTPTTTFPLLDAVSVVGEPSEALTRQWAATRHGLIRLLDAGRIAAG